MRSLRRGLVFGTVMLGYVAAAAAQAKTSYPTCTTTPTEADRKAAQGAFTAGQGSFNEADYTTAIMYWRDAYRRDCTAHKLLLNLARAYEAKGDRAEAVTALETYLARKPDDPEAELYQRRIQNLKAQLTAPPAATTAPVAQPAPAATTTQLAPEQPGGPSGKLNLPPLFVAGGGVLVAIIGGVVYAGGQSKLADAEKTCPNRICPSNPYDKATDPASYQQWNATRGLVIEAAKNDGNSGRTQANIGGAFLGLGIVAAIGGGIRFAVKPRLKPTTANAHTLTLGANTNVQPAIGPGFVGVSLGGSF